MTGSTTGSTTTDGSGNYALNAYTGDTVTVTPGKLPLLPGASGINNVDVIAVLRHFLGVTLIPPGCRLTAADVTGDANITVADVVAVQRFYLGITTGTANVGKYQFSPTSRNYLNLTTNQSVENYSALIFGDVAAPSP